MKVVVTGATGFIGNYLIRDLLDRKLEVFATSSNWGRAKEMDWFSRVSYHAFSIGDDMDEKTVCFFEDADVVIHLAWQGLPDFKSDNHIHLYLKQQKKFITQLTTLKIKRLINIGTCLEYGLQEGGLSEEMPVCPVVNYAIAKNELRLYTEQIESSFENGTCWIRLFYMFGEGQSKKSFLPQLHQAIIEQRETFDMSDGEQERDYLPVQKVSEYIARIALNQNAQGIINCASGKPIKIRTLAEEFIKKMDSSIQLNLGVYPYPDYEPVCFWGINNKMRGILNEEV